MGKLDRAKLKKFYQKPIKERIKALKDAQIISQEQRDLLLNESLDIASETGDNMIENYIGNYSLPLGTALNFVINGKERVIPIAIEEPSVIAAASFAGKIIARSGGFQTETKQRLMIGQVILKEVENIEKAKQVLIKHRQEIINRANQAHPSIVERGGGACEIEVRHIPENLEDQTPEFLILHVHIDTKEAMGANMVNTMMESIAPYIESLTHGRALMKILSNYATQALTTARCEIDPSTLSVPGLKGQEVAERIAEASMVAWVDPYRAVTNNKGVMNGIDGLIIASGNDWRATAAGIHTYASESGQYRSLTKWRLNSQTNQLEGQITLPLAVGTVGGSISFHPGAKLTHSILENPSAKELAQIIAAVGLGQNFAALRALVTEGIQKGHMALQAKSLAISAGAKGDMIEQVAQALAKEPQMNLAKAKELIKKFS